MKREAEALKEALRQEARRAACGTIPDGAIADDAEGLSVLISAAEPSSSAAQEASGVAGYVASLQGDVKALTEGISPETVEAMKLLINFVVGEGGPCRGRNCNEKAGAKRTEMENKDAEMELPGSALKQLALWQLVLGYRLREAEATGEYRKMLES